MVTVTRAWADATPDDVESWLGALAPKRGASAIELLRRASRFAAQAHAGQRRASGEPYVHHAFAVASILAELELKQAALANRLGIWQVKWELEDLAFRYLEPVAYKQIASLLAEKRVDREQYIERVRARLAQALTRAGVDAEVSGRPKHIYGIWRKMRR